MKEACTYEIMLLIISEASYDPLTVNVLLHSHVLASREGKIFRLKNKATKPLWARTRSRRVSHDHGNCTPDRVRIPGSESCMQEGGDPFIDFLFAFFLDSKARLLKLFNPVPAVQV